jgi:hypothetical protein
MCIHRGRKQHGAKTYMKIHSKVVIDLNTNEILEDHWEEYSGPLVLCETESSTNVPPPTAAQQKLMDISAKTGEQQFQAMLAQGGLQNLLLQFAPGLLEQIGGSLGVGASPNAPKVGLPSDALSSSEQDELKQLLGEQSTSGTSIPSPILRGIMQPTGDGPVMSAEKLARLNELQARSHNPAASPMSFGPSTQPNVTSQGNQPASGIDSELQGLQLGRIRAGGAATPDDISLIDQSAQAAIDAGGSDINNFFQQSLQTLKQELAPSLGLHPGDSPILDRGGKLANEALRQYGNLVTTTRGNAAQQRLQFPLQRSTAIDAQTGNMRSFEQSLQQFQEDLKQRAFANRTQLLNSISGSGLGLAGQGGPAMPNLPTGSTTSSSDPFKSAAGIGTAAYGLSQAIPALAALSSRRLKNKNVRIDDAKILEKLKKLDVEEWVYIGGKEKHIGPYAEDFKELFGIGDGKTINLMDAVGILMASVKALARQHAGT